MALYFTKYMSKRTGATNGKWYARAKVTQVDSIETLAKKIEEKCTVHYADVVAVLAALSGEITDAVQNSHRVKLPGLGSFKLNISTKAADSEKEFKSSNIKNAHIVFTPETTRSAGKVQTRAFITGTTFREWDTNAEASDSTSSGSSTDAGGGSSNTGGSTPSGGGGSSDSGGADL